MKRKENIKPEQLYCFVHAIRNQAEILVLLKRDASIQQANPHLSHYAALKKSMNEIIAQAL